MAYRDKKTGELFPSQKYYNAVQQVESKGLPRTTTNIQKVMSGSDKSLGDSTSLKGTLAGPKTKEIPTEDINDLSLMQLVLSEVSQEQYATGLKKGIQQTTKGLKDEGVNIKMSRGGVGNIVGFVENQVRSSITKQQQNFTNLISALQSSQQQQQKTARSNLSTLMSTGAIADMNDEDAIQLGTTAGIPEEQILAIKKQYEANDKVIDTYTKMVEKSGSNAYSALTQVPSNIRNKVVEKVNWDSLGGKLSDGGGGKSGDWTMAEQFIKDNPDADYDTLYKMIRSNTDLGISDTEQLLKGKEGGQFTDIEQMTIDLVKNMGKEDTINSIENDEDYSDKMKQKMKDIIEEKYPEGRTWLQKTLPGGR